MAALVMQGEKGLWFNNIKLHGHRSKEKGRDKPCLFCISQVVEYFFTALIPWYRNAVRRYILE